MTELGNKLNRQAIKQAEGTTQTGRDLLAEAEKLLAFPSEQITQELARRSSERVSYSPSNVTFNGGELFSQIRSVAFRQR